VFYVLFDGCCLFVSSFLFTWFGLAPARNEPLIWGNLLCAFLRFCFFFVCCCFSLCTFSGFWLFYHQLKWSLVPLCEFIYSGVWVFSSQSDTPDGVLVFLWWWRAPDLWTSGGFFLLGCFLGYLCMALVGVGPPPPHWLGHGWVAFRCRKFGIFFCSLVVDVFLLYWVFLFGVWIQPKQTGGLRRASKRNPLIWKMLSVGGAGVGRGRVARPGGGSGCLVYWGEGSGAYYSATFFAFVFFFCFILWFCLSCEYVFPPPPNLSPPPAPSWPPVTPPTSAIVVVWNYYLFVAGVAVCVLSVG